MSFVSFCAWLGLFACSPVKPVWKTPPDVAAHRVTAAGVDKVAVVARGRLELRAASSGRVVRSIPLTGGTYSVVSCSATYCVVAGGEHSSGTIIVVDLESGTVRHPDESTHYAEVYGAIALDKQKFATAHGDETVILWDLDTFVPIRRFVRTGGLEMYAVDSQDGNIVASNDRGEIVSWSVETGSIVASAVLTSPIFGVVAKNNSVVANGNRELFVMDNNLVLKYKYDLKDVNVVSCQQSLTNTILCGLSDGELLAVDGYSVKKTNHLVGVEAISFAVAGNNAVTVAVDGSLLGWDLHEK